MDPGQLSLTADNSIIKHFETISGLTKGVLGHFCHGHFGLGHFGPDISATDVSAAENAKGECFGHNHKLWVGVCASINW